MSVKLATNIRVVGAELYFLPVQTRVPLKFGAETLTSVTCARVRLRVRDSKGNMAEGWGETPLSVQWVWPSKLPYEARHQALKEFCRRLAERWASFDAWGHAMEVGYDFQQLVLPELTRRFNEDGSCSRTEEMHGRAAHATGGSYTGRSGSSLRSEPGVEGGRQFIGEPMPYLAALVCCSPFDLALHDAYGNLVGRPVYQTYSRAFMGRDLASYLECGEGSSISFAGKYPGDFLLPERRVKLPAWHLVGGLDAIDPAELTGEEPRDGYPVLLRDWIRTDGLKCLKVKLRGNDADWDRRRLVRVGQIAIEEGVDWLTADFNCTVTDPSYVNGILDELRDERPRVHGMLLYVEQPFPYDLEAHRIDVHSVSARKPLFMDESAHDWRLVKLGRSLGWSGVALKTCKTQTGALLSLCWAKAHGMTLMVQDLTNPMLAQVPHVLLAGHAGTIMGVETNAMQFYPDASGAEAEVHPGLYSRRQGQVELSTVMGPGFGYRVTEIRRALPRAEVSALG